MMRSNYHKIKAIVNNIHNYSEVIYGALGSIQSIFRTNVINVKNTIETKLRIKLNGNNLIKITSKPVDTLLKINSKTNDNRIIVKNEITHDLLSKMVANTSNIKVINSLLLYIAKIVNITNRINIKNNLHHVLKIKIKPSNDNNIVIQNSIDPHVNIGLYTSEDQNDIVISQPSVNAEAWFFVRLEAMSGGLNSYYNQTINDTGRKKVV